jgi:hypothetical protein
MALVGEKIFPRRSCGSVSSHESWEMAGRGEARMTIDDKAKIALQQPDTVVLATEMNPELAEKFSRVAGQVDDLLRANTRGPGEAYMILHFLMKNWEDIYGIRGAMVTEHGGES